MQTSTQLKIPSEQAIGLFFNEALEHDLPVERDGVSLRVTSPYGEVHISDENNGVRLTISAPDSTKLYVLQETVDHILSEIGAADSLNWSASRAGSLPANLCIATVEACTRISPSYYRVRIADPGLERFARDGLHFRLLFGPQDHAGEWPTIAETGRTLWPGGADAWHRPVYTTRFIDPQAGILEFDVFIHAGGRVTDWCRRVQCGEKIAITGPGGEWHPAAGWLALFADETALPAIARMLEAAPESTKGQAVIVASHRDDIQTLAAPEGVSVRWILRGGKETLPDALAGMNLPQADRFVWFAGEKSEVVNARKKLSALGLAKHEWRAAAYWMR
ncbi:DUF2218 domain-containing protein [Roseibium aggregatum]|uniref:Siderophore-interacting protein n=1 Tax=Roseibium aggregatum TaxID=187304 RepID=A0A939J1M3_9HYPH|nr:siderophore-interacting protein [Roseibium aggregatum]MBN9672296.1 siderophore-interacting protein [Roseibium aggregatum]